MGWFESLHDNLEENGYGHLVVLPEEFHDEAISLLEKKLGKKETPDFLKQFQGIEDLHRLDLCLDRFIHKDIPKGKTRKEYLIMANEIPDHSDWDFLYMTSDSWFDYMVGATFKQFYEFSKQVDVLKQDKGPINDHRDYEHVINPVLSTLLEKYGVKKSKTSRDLGGITKEGDILYLPDSSSEMFVKGLNERYDKLPEDFLYLNFLNFSGEYSNWKKALKEEEIDFFKDSDC